MSVVGSCRVVVPCLLCDDFGFAQVTRTTKVAFELPRPLVRRLLVAMQQAQQPVTESVQGSDTSAGEKAQEGDVVSGSRHAASSEAASSSSSSSSWKTKLLEEDADLPQVDFHRIIVIKNAKECKSQLGFTEIPVGRVLTMNGACLCVFVVSILRTLFASMPQSQYRVAQMLRVWHFPILALNLPFLHPLL